MSSWNGALSPLLYVSRFLPHTRVLAPYRSYSSCAVPSENVATVAACASVVEGVSRSRNALLNGDTRNYDWDSGYTCHQLGSGAIVIQLAQPYCIGSLR